jgi:hypothetical protein
MGVISAPKYEGTWGQVKRESGERGDGEDKEVKEFKSSKVKE